MMMQSRQTRPRKQFNTMLKPNLPSFNDPEGSTVPSELPDIIDAHVHVFPTHIFSAIRNWFDEHAWHIRYELTTAKVFDFLLARGVRHIIALQYAHKPGIARHLNRYMADKCATYEHQVTGMATVFPGEEDAAEILQEAFDSGLMGLKLHAHVQCFDMNCPDMNELYECCRLNHKPIVMHVGREPRSTAYKVDPYEICSADRVERVLRDFPDLKVCVPHLGFDEIEVYRKMIETYDNLWLDTTMVITDYFPIAGDIDLNHYRLDRVMYGSDFPNIPYAWDRELKRLKALGLSFPALERILNRSATDFFGLGS
ncbi:MAG TPA: amidohydrolase family protein [Desulfobacteria bacterium]|nr:amidohydrolase family protein [Desulfobacteria bacterium]